MSKEFTPRRPKARANKDWYRIENKADDGVAEIFIYDEISDWGVSASSFLDDVKALGDTDLTLHLNSPGGDVFDGLAIYQMLKARAGRTTVIVDGLAASIASVIAMGADHLVMAPKASLMIHDGLTYAAGNAAEMRKVVELLDRVSDNIASIYADRAGQTAKFWRARMIEETWYSADEAFEAGLIDQIEGQDPKRDDFDLSMYNHAGRENAPAPVLKDEVGPEPVVEEGTLVVPTMESKEPEPFTWDFAAFKSSLKEGITRG